ncbi:hypothetical protein N8480_01465 [Flavobacteriaceae bacterium]|nr:hypothetical protein [Flavobacteriaceae bacterium]
MIAFTLNSLFGMEVITKHFKHVGEKHVKHKTLGITKQVKMERSGWIIS